MAGGGSSFAHCCTLAAQSKKTTICLRLGPRTCLPAMNEMVPAVGDKVPIQVIATGIEGTPSLLSSLHSWVLPRHQTRSY